MNDHGLTRSTRSTEEIVRGDTPPSVGIDGLACLDLGGHEAAITIHQHTQKEADAAAVQMIVAVQCAGLLHDLAMAVCRSGGVIPDQVWILASRALRVFEQRRCCRCGCTEDNPCDTLDGAGCSWVKKDVCSECAPPKAKKKRRAK